MKSVVEIEHLTKSYGKSRGVIDVSLKIKEGDIFGFLGPNGAGKSTTIRSMLGFLKINSGKITILGMDSIKDHEEILKNVGYMPSEAWFYESMKVKDVIKYAADVRGLDCSAEAEKLCARLKVDVNKKIKQLSYGNKKKVDYFPMSEAAFLIWSLDQREDWATRVCLVGGGQEINTGEAGITEWISSLNNMFPHWKVYISPKLTEPEYAEGKVNELLKDNQNVTFNEKLHLGVSLRSFRAEKLSAFVHSLLAIDGNAASIYNEIKAKTLQRK